jgi:periplasmic protein TonB
MKRIATMLGIALLAAACASNSRPPDVVAAKDFSYPRAASEQRVEGFVRVAYEVGVDGSVTNARVVESSPTGMFDDAALEAVRGWRFHPAIRNGKPVAYELTSTLKFKLGESEAYAR